MLWFFLVGLLFGFETFLSHISIPLVNLCQSPPWMLPMYIQWLCVRSWMLKIKTLEIKCWKLLILPVVMLILPLVHIHFPLCDFSRFKSLYLSTQNYTITTTTCLQGRLNGFVPNSPILSENTKKIAIKVKRERDYGFGDFWGF